MTEEQYFALIEPNALINPSQLGQIHQPTTPPNTVQTVN
jgi:hypothetical protein